MIFSISTYLFVSSTTKKECSGYMTGSGLIIMNIIQLGRLFARLIGDSELIPEPDAALTLTRKRYIEI